MTDQQDLANLLSIHMKKASIGDARLAKLVNSIADNPYFVHRSTIRNWRNGTSKSVSNWRKLVTVAIALTLDETQANKLLASGGCPSIQALRAQGNEADQALLAYWQHTPAQATALPTTTIDVDNNSPQLAPAHDGKTVESSFKLWKSGKIARVLTFAGIATVLGIILLRVGNAPGELHSQPEQEFVLPKIKSVELGRQCLIDLATQPTGAIWAHGESTDCPELIIFHQYGEYTSDDLEPWNEGVAQCFVTTALVRLWIAFDLPGGGEGWLRLTWFDAGAPYFREEEPVTPTLWESPKANSTIVASSS